MFQAWQLSFLSLPGKHSCTHKGPKTNRVEISALQHTVDSIIPNKRPLAQRGLTSGLILASGDQSSTSLLLWKPKICFTFFRAPPLRGSQSAPAAGLGLAYGSWVVPDQHKHKHSTIASAVQQKSVCSGGTPAANKRRPLPHTHSDTHSWLTMTSSSTLV